MATGVNREWPSNLLHQGSHSEIEWWSWVPNEKRASRGDKRYEIGSCFKVSPCPWIGYAHDLYQRVLQWDWGHNWDAISGVLIEELSDIRQVMRQRNSPRWEGRPRSNATQKQKLWASESPSTEVILSLCIAWPSFFGREKQPQLPIASIREEEAKRILSTLA